MRKFAFLVVALFSLQILASEPVPVNGFTAQELEWMAQKNAVTTYQNSLVPGYLAKRNQGRALDLLERTEVRPFAEYQKAGYLIFSSQYDFNSRQAKLTMAQNLPEDVHLVVFTGSTNMSAARKLKNTYSDLIGEDRVSIVFMPDGARGFWARDGVPVPVLRNEPKQAQKELALVDARYYHHFEADEQFGDLFNSVVTKHDYFYEGGNFMANKDGTCLVINTVATKKVPTTIFEDHYGCKNLIRLPFVKGIGHADESVKFVNEKTVLTDEPSYQETLQKAGYKVVLLPRPSRRMETYVNSLIVDQVVYVPIFDQETDKQALQVYKDQGFKKVIGINSYSLSNHGQGSLHCITMTYPPVEMNDLLKSMGGHILL